MKILFLPGTYPFCYYYRGFLPGVYSNQMVVKDFVVLREKSDPEVVKAQMQKADVIVFQRPQTKEIFEVFKQAKRMGKKVIFENDDSYKIGEAIILEDLDNYKQRKVAKEFAKYTDLMISLADGVIASTEFLANEFRALNPKVTTLKNCIDPLDEFPVKPNTTGKFRIGFVASVATNDDYLHIKEDIRRLDARGDITIVVLGVKYKDGHVPAFMKKDQEFWGSLTNVEWHPYVPITEYMMTLADLCLDLCVIPRKDSYFNRCKSNLKFLESSLLKIPVIAQGFTDGKSPYQGKDEPYMTIMLDESWYDAIVAIRDDYSTYKARAEKAYTYVLQDYNISTYAPMWVAEIKKLVT